MYSSRIFVILLLVFTISACDDSERKSKAQPQKGIPISVSILRVADASRMAGEVTSCALKKKKIDNSPLIKSMLIKAQLGCDFWKGLKEKGTELIKQHEMRLVKSAQLFVFEGFEKGSYGASTHLIGPFESLSSCVSRRGTYLEFSDGAGKCRTLREHIEKDEIIELDEDGFDWKKSNTERPKRSE